MKAVLLFVMLAMAGVSFADSIDDAEAARRGITPEQVRAEHASQATSRPAEDVATLKAQIVALQAQVTELKRELAATKPSPTLAQFSAVNLRAAENARLAELSAGSPSPAWTASTKRMLDSIEKYLESHPGDVDYVHAMFEADPKIGMSEADIDALLAARLVISHPVRLPDGVRPPNPPSKNVTSQSATERIVEYNWSDKHYVIDFLHGKVVRIDNP